MGLRDVAESLQEQADELKAVGHFIIKSGDPEEAKSRVEDIIKDIETLINGLDQI